MCGIFLWLLFVVGLFALLVQLFGWVAGIIIFLLLSGVGSKTYYIYK